MKTRDIKTVDVQAREWFDKVNGNSYFSTDITVNYGLNNAVSFYLPMQYGHGDHYRYEAFEEIKKRLKCFNKAKIPQSYWNTYEQFKIIARHSKRNVLKREL